MNWKIYGPIAVAAVLLLIILPRILRSRRKKKELRRQADDKLREEALDRVLTGGRSVPEGRGSAPVPFDVRYDSEQRKKPQKAHPAAASGPRAMVMVQLVEQTELSTRKYMFHVKDRITFGDRTAQNDIIVTGPKIAKRHCEIFRLGRDLYIKCLEEGRQVVLRRKKRRTSVELEAVKLADKDVIQIGDSTYTLEILKN